MNGGKIYVLCMVQETGPHTTASGKPTKISIDAMAERHKDSFRTSRFYIEVYCILGCAWSGVFDE